MLIVLQDDSIIELYNVGISPYFNTMYNTSLDVDMNDNKYVFDEYPSDIVESYITYCNTGTIDPFTFNIELYDYFGHKLYYRDHIAIQIKILEHEWYKLYGIQPVTISNVKSMKLFANMDLENGTEYLYTYTEGKLDKIELGTRNPYIVARRYDICIYNGMELSKITLSNYLARINTTILHPDVIEKNIRGNIILPEYDNFFYSNIPIFMKLKKYVKFDSLDLDNIILTEDIMKHYVNTTLLHISKLEIIKLGLSYGSGDGSTMPYIKALLHGKLFSRGTPIIIRDYVKTNNVNYRNIEDMMDDLYNVKQLEELVDKFIKLHG